MGIHSIQQSTARERERRREEGGCQEQNEGRKKEGKEGRKEGRKGGRKGGRKARTYPTNEDN